MLINFNKVQGRYPWFKIPNLMFYIVLFSGIIYISDFILRLTDQPVLISSMLSFDKNLILKGEVWRIVTYIFLVPKLRIMMIFLYLYVLNFIGNSLEIYWGSVNLTLYYLLGSICTTASGFVTGTTNMIFLNLSLVFVCAFMYPDIGFHLFNFINIRMRWLGFVATILFLTKIVISLVIWNPSNLLAECVAILMFLLFFGPYYFINMFNRLKMLMNRPRF